MITYEVIADTLTHRSNTKKIDVTGCSTVLVEVVSGHCFINDVLPLRASAPTEGEYVVRSRTFDAPKDGVFASEIYISEYSSSLTEYDLLITKNKQVQCD